MAEDQEHPDQHEPEEQEHDRGRDERDRDRGGHGGHPYEVTGEVTGKEGAPLADARVVVWWQQLRTRTELTAGQTDHGGRYRLRYELPSQAPEPVLIVIEALSEYLDEPLFSQPTKVAPTLTIDLGATPADTSEWATLTAAIDPLLGGVKLDELVEDSTHHDLSFLAGEISKDVETLMRVALSARLENAFGVPAPVFYAFLRQRVPAALPSPLLDASQGFALIGPLVQNVGSLIFALTADTQTRALTAAVALDLIGPQFTDQIPRFVEQLQGHRVTDLLGQPYLVGSSSLSELLDAGGVPSSQQQAFAQALATNTQSMRNFWRTLGSGGSGLSAQQASTIERALSIGAFVKNYAPLVQNLLGAFDAGTYKALPDLARLSVDDWVALVGQTGGPPPSIEAAGTASAAEVFARVIRTRVTRAYPTAALSGQIASGAFVPESAKQALTAFFTNNPELELVKDSIPAYLAKQGEDAFTGIDAGQQQQVIDLARRFQRVLRVAPKPDVAESLLTLGIGSATEIHTLGEQQFFHRATGAGLTKPEASAAFRAATERYGSLVSLYMQLNRGSIGLWPHAIGDTATLNEPIGEAINGDQSLATLFGSEDYCASEDCTSVLSPAAYLCDLLMWLRNHRQGSLTALDVLDQRRPDIRHLLLNCPNSETELPYIDLVNELLADAISAPIEALANTYTQQALQDGTTYYYVITAMNSVGESPASAQVSATPAAAAAAPAAPAGVTATAGDGQNTIAWSPDAGATAYNIYWSTTSGVTPATGTRIANATSPSVHAGLTDGTAYFYVVTAVNAIGEGAASPEASATPTAPVTAPAAPTGVTVGPGDTELTISWDPVSGASAYNVYWSTSAGVTPANGTRIPGASSPYLQTALINGTTYHYVVTAVNAIGEGPASAEMTGTPAVPAAGPAPPTGVTALAGDGQVTLSWNLVPGATSYNIYWSTAPGVTIANGTKIAGSWNPGWKQTSAARTAAELRAAPEYFNQGAFATLFAASYPHALPYSAGLDELRTYVGQLGLPLWQLREALLPFTGATLAQEAAVAAERLQLPPHGADLITTANLVTPEIAWNTANPLLALASVPAFLQAASITYEALLELLDVQWVQGGLGTAINGIDDTCMTSVQFLAPLDAGFLDRAHRFLRLWSATGCQMWELDLLLRSTSVGNGTLDQNALTQLLQFRKLQDTTRLQVDELLAFYQDIDVSSHRQADGSTAQPLYERVFMAPTVTSVTPDSDLAAIATGGTVADPVLDHHLAGIQAALSVSAADAGTLFGLTDGTLTLANLSMLYRTTKLAAAAKLQIVDLLTIAGLLDPTAANAEAALAPVFASPSATTTFIADAGTIRQSNLTLDAVTYLLRPPSATTLATAIAAADTTITVADDQGFPAANFYVTIGTETLLVTAAGGAGNATWTVVRGQQGTTAAAAAAGVPVALAVGWATTTQMTPTDIATALAAVRQAAAGLLSASTTLSAPITAVDTTITLAGYQGFPAPPYSVAIGSEILQVTAVGGTGNTTWTVLRGQQGTTAAAAATGVTVTPTGADLDGVVIAAVAADAHTSSGAGIANDVTALILQTLTLPGSAQTLLATLTDPAFTGSTAAVTAGTFPQQFLAIRLFDKLAALVRALRFVVPDLQWLLGNAATYGGLDLTQLPVTPAQPALPLQPLLVTLLLVKLARLWAAAPPTATIQTLYDVIGGVHGGSLADAAAAQNALATITGWPLVDVGVLAASLALAFPADYTNPTAYDALRRLEQMASTADATGAQLVSWGQVPADEATAEGLASGALGVIKAQQATSDAWLALAPTLMDPIRERRSAALQAYLIGQRDLSGNLIYGDTDGLFDHFLIDVQMSSCQVTSRIVQAYIAVQIFVERCLMNLEVPNVVVDLTQDDTWSQWSWMDRYRVWEANREVFLYPENWLIESQRPNRTELYKTFEQEVQQGQSTADYLETVVLNYLGRLDDLAHLYLTGTCEDPSTGDIHVVARTLADPPVYYHRTYASGAWGGWIKIPLDIKAHQVVPALYRGRLCLFWLDVKVASEPQQTLSPPQASSSPPSQVADRYVAMGIYFSVFSNGSWQPAQASKGKVFDKPFYESTATASALAIESLYTLKLQSPAPSPGYGANLFVDVFRLGHFQSGRLWGSPEFVYGVDETVAVHLGRAVFDGRFSDLELRDLPVPSTLIEGDVLTYAWTVHILSHAQSSYGADAQPLLPLPDSQADPDLVSDSQLVPQAGALTSRPANPAGGANQTQQLDFTAAGSLEQNVGPLLLSAPLPLRVIGPDGDLNFDPASYFFFQDTRRCYWVESQKYYWTGSFWSPVAPSDPTSAPYQVRYVFHPFYHAFTRLLWHQLGSGDFAALYDVNLQLNPDQVDPSGADVLSFNTTYAPVLPRVWWDHDDLTGQDRQFLDFRPGAAFGVYNWELFYHVPMYVAQLLGTNQQFEAALRWYQYVFNPTRQGGDPVPQRFWIPKPLHDLTSAEIIQQQINNLLLAVNHGDPAAVAMVNAWRQSPFNPFVLADLRPVAYMKSTVMAYLDNLIAWADNLFASESREALSEATLIYVIASEILGAQPQAVTPPEHADESFDQLEPALDAFANAMVEIENVIGGAGASGPSGGGDGGVPAAHTFYFKIPSNPKLLGYWTTVADRLYKLRHCQTISGAPLQLALFDAPIDPGLLIAAQSAGVDLTSVLTDLAAPLPNYRFTALYPQALDFVNAVRAYGSSLQAALEKNDAGALQLLQQTLQQQLLVDGNDVLDWQVQQAEKNLAALGQALQLAQQKSAFNHGQDFANAAEVIGTTMTTASAVIKAISAATQVVGAVAHVAPDFTVGAAGFGGSPVATVTDGGTHAGHAGHRAGNALSITADILSIGGALSSTLGSWWHRKDAWDEAAKEADIQIDQTQAQIDAAQFALLIAQRNVELHQEQIDDLQKQIDFLNDKFTSDSLYQWMVSSLSATYFQSYQLAYQLCKAVERCYRFELGIEDSSFIQFGYWDSLHKGLLAGETLNHDLRRMQSSYLQQNQRRLEISRYVSLGLLDPVALQTLLRTGSCDFTVPESLFDNDYPGHYNRRLTRASVTVVYPSPGRFDNVKATLTLVANQVRVSTDTSAGYAEGSVGAVGSDPRFIYNYAAVPQKIALGNAQDDPGLFVTAIASNITDQRYLPFENAGAISSWHLEMLTTTNEIDLSTVSDVILHLYYTALDGGGPLEDTVKANNDANAPTTGVQLFSAQSDFPATFATDAEPYPLTAWQGFLMVPPAPNPQLLTLKLLHSKFPAFTRGKTISVNSITLVALSLEPGGFKVTPEAPLPTAELTMAPVPGMTQPNMYSTTINLPANTPIGTWSFAIKQASATDYRSITKDKIGDVLLLVDYTLS